MLALGQGSEGSSSEALPLKSVFTDPEEYLISSVLQAPYDGISWGLRGMRLKTEILHFSFRILFLEAHKTAGSHPQAGGSPHVGAP